MLASVQERERAFLITIGYWTVRAVLLLTGIWLGLRLFLPLWLGLALAYLLRPLFRFIHRHSSMSGRFAAVAAAAVFYSAAGLVLYGGGALLYLRLDDWFTRFPTLYRENIAPGLAQLGEKTLGWMGRGGKGADGPLLSLEQGLEQGVASLSEWLLASAGGVLKSVPPLLLALLFAVVSSVLISADYAEVSAFLLRQIPARLHRPLLDCRDFLVRTLGKLVRAYLILSALTFGLVCLGLWMLGMPVWGMAALTALFDLLPVLGSGTVLIPWGVYHLLLGNYLQGGGLLALWAVCTAVRQLLEPRIVGKKLGLHPLATVAAMYAGLRLAGFWGLVSAPVLCILLQYLQQQGVLRLYR